MILITIECPECGKPSQYMIASLSKGYVIYECESGHETKVKLEDEVEDGKQ